MSGPAAVSDRERRVWDLLTRDFYWDIPPDQQIAVYGEKRKAGPPKLQIFEVAMTTIMARLHPDYEWQVTRAGRDGGLDFIGRLAFLDDSTLGIAATITVGGQCKKRTQVKGLAGTLSESLMNMVSTANPTFFVVALSARVTPKKLAKVQRQLESTHHRHCHILDRVQLEGLLREHLDSLEEVLCLGLAEDQVAEVMGYLVDHDDGDRAITVDAVAPERVLAGVPFIIDVSLRSTFASSPDARVWWSPVTGDAPSPPVELIGPVGAGSPGGVVLSAAGGDDPLFTRLTFEMVSYAVGQVDLGQVVVGRGTDGTATALHQAAIGSVQVIDNTRPRFFARPVRHGLEQLEQAFDRSLAGGLATAGVVGAGGSGKSRMCEEFALGHRRRGASVVTAKQAKGHDEPYYLLAQLMFALTDEPNALGDHPAEAVIRSVARFDARLARKVGPSLRSLFGAGDSADASMIEQELLTVLLVLISARARKAPLIIHLQDLHWCTTDILKLLERLIWQLEQLLSEKTPGRSRGVLVMLEGRIQESDPLGSEGWSSAPYESFLDRIDGTSVTCAAFTPRDGLDFVRLLFEDSHSAAKLVSDDLLGLQRELIERVDRSAGGNPFHSLAQVQLLRERGVLGRNPETGLHYLIKPEPIAGVLPDSVFASIRLRWQYIKERRPDLALLVWACSLLDDRIPETLFRQLRSDLAPDVARRDVDATDMLWTGDGFQQEVGFRHENYFNALRSFDLPADQRTRAVQVYNDWFATLRALSPTDRFRWARVLLEAPEPDLKRVRGLLRSARRGAEQQRDAALARRILATQLDLAWAEDVRSPLPSARFLGWCDEELLLLWELLDLDRTKAQRRLGPFRERIRHRLAPGRRSSPTTIVELHRRRLAGEVLHANVLFNDQHPDVAAEVAQGAMRDIAMAQLGATPEETGGWEALEMEALHTYAVALAIAGEVAPAIEPSARAVEIAWRVGTDRAYQVIGTHGNILLAVDPDAGVALLRECLDDAARRGRASETDRVEIHLAIGLAILAHRCPSADASRAELIAEVRDRLTPLVRACFRLGLYPDAGAAALMLGIVSVLDDSGEAVSWFAQAVAASARGRQMETLWKAHINLALALHRDGGSVAHGVRDHARTALEIMEESLASYTHPDRSPRFGLLRTSMAHAVSFLVLAGDDAGIRALERYPGLRACFADAAAGELREDLGPAPGDHGWVLRVGDAHFILY